jgi:hypothetical protein
VNDLKCCIRHNGKVYCWDEANGRIVHIIINDIEASECPDYVIRMLMKEINKKPEK